MEYDFDYIQDLESLSTWCSTQSEEETVAVDTEFERRTTYYPELCLVQVATSKSIVCVDPILCKNVSPLVTFLNEPNRIKILHAARQDLEVLELIGVYVEETFFDNQIGAALIGEDDQIGYGDLAKNLLSVELNKNQQQANWKRRPLRSQQLRYAASDVRYLLPIYSILCEKLIACGRFKWFEEECRNLAERSKSKPSNYAWQRLKNINHLKKDIALRACSLANWREKESRRINTPRNWLLKDSDIKKIAVLNPSNLANLADVLTKKEEICRKYGGAVLTALKSADSLHDIGLVRENRISDEEKKKVKMLVDRGKKIADKLEIKPTFLMTGKDSKDIVTGKKPKKFFAGWRFSVFRESFGALGLL